MIVFTTTATSYLGNEPIFELDGELRFRRVPDDRFARLLFHFAATFWGTNSINFVAP